MRLPVCDDVRVSPNWGREVRVVVHVECEVVELRLTEVAGAEVQRGLHRLRRKLRHDLGDTREVRISMHVVISRVPT